MRKGEFPDGSRTLRAKIDMASPNMNLRDPVMYRIVHERHHRQGDAWPIYPTYDWAHGLEDSIEEITHSICTLEFENHRPLYDWFLNALEIYHPQQIEFARLNLSYTVLSKRKLLQLVEGNHVTGWDDPRMPTIAGYRRRGYTAESVRTFCEKIGVSKKDSIIDVSLLEWSVREDLNKHAARTMVVLDPVKVVLLNYPPGQVEELPALNNPEDESAGTRLVRSAMNCILTARISGSSHLRNTTGYPQAGKSACGPPISSSVKRSSRTKTGRSSSYTARTMPETKSGNPSAERKVKGTIHWVSARHAVDVQVRLYDRLFLKEDPDDVPEGQTFLANVNPDSLQVRDGCKAEPILARAGGGSRFQFERVGYFCGDMRDLNRASRCSIASSA